MRPSRGNYPRPTEPLLNGGIASMPVHVRVYRAGDWSVVQIEGELDIQSVPSVRPLPPGEDALVVFDLHGTTFMDCNGLGLMVGAARTASQRGGCVRVASDASSQVRKLIRLANVDGALPMFDSLHEALTAPRPGPSAADSSPRNESQR